MVKKVIPFILVLTIILSTGLIFSVGCNREKEVKYTGETYGLGAYLGLDELAKLRPDVFFEQQSSYDRDGGNVDGFGMVLPDGKNESGEADGDSVIKRVLLNLQSPGVVYRMFFTNFGDVPNLRIYIDGKKTVDMSLADLTSGKNYPFVYPFVQNKTQSSGGFVCYLPIAFAESIEIIGSGNFYCSISYHVYPADAKIQPFTMDIDLADATKILTSLGSDPKYKADNQTKEEKFTLNSNAKKTLEINGKRSVSSISLKIPSVTAVQYDRRVYASDGIRLSAGEKAYFDIEAEGGAILKGRYCIESNAQSANVYVNGVRIGAIEIRARRLDGFEWKDDDYFEDISIAIPSSVVNGKSKVSVRIEATSKISFYSLSVEKAGKTIDSVDFGNEQSKSEHAFQATNYSTVRREAEYNPNSLITAEEQAKIYANEDLLNSLRIKVYYDGEKTPRVDAPISLFFGFGMFGAYETQTLMSGIKADGTMYSYYPMPFENNCKIEIVNSSNKKIEDLQLTVAHKEFEGNIGEYGYFSTQYNQYLSGTTSALKSGEYFDLLKQSGAGHLVGVSLSMTGNYFGETSRYYLEGDEVLYVDGNKSFTAHGTGTEDFFNGGWYFKNGTQVNPLYGNTAHNTRSGLDRTAMIRNMVGDYIPFRNGIHLMMEHGGNNNRTDCNVYALTYYYHYDKPLIEQTDKFKVYEGQSKNYNASNFESKSYTATGEALYKKYTYTNTYNYVLGESSFEITISPENNGVLLRRLMNADLLEQSAKVYVDGEYVGIWNERFRAALNYIRWEDYFIPSKYTAGKNKITVKLVNFTGESGEIIPWTESEYIVYSFNK